MIRAHRKSFQVIVYAGRRFGKDVYTRQSAPTLAAAKQVEKNLTAQVARARNGNPAATVAELLDRWLAHAEPDLAETTVHTYRSYIDRVIVPELGKTKLGRLNPAVLDDFYSSLRATLAPATIKQIHAIIHRACAVAVRWGWLASNPASNAAPPRVGRHEQAPPEPEAITRFLTGLVVMAWARSTSPELAVFMRLAFITGARRGELCALRWSDVDLAAGVVTIRHSLSIPGGRAPTQKDTKSHGVRRLSVGGGTLAQLELHRAAEEEKSDWAGVRFDPAGYVFTTKPGTPWHPDVASGRYRRAARAAWGPRHAPRLHDWRHANATSSLKGGHPDVQVAHRLGHSSTKMTHDVYSHVTPVGDQAIAVTLDDLLDG